MILFQKKEQAKQTASEKARANRLKRQFKATTQASLAYKSLYEEGLMHVVDDTYSMTFELGNASYTTAEFPQKVQIGSLHSKSFDILDVGSTMQLLVLNRRIPQTALSNVLYEEQNDDVNIYRQELNSLIKKRFDVQANNFEVHKYITISQEAMDRKQGQISLQNVGVVLQNNYKQASISLSRLNGHERLEIFYNLLRGQDTLPYTYKDLALAGLTTKDLIAPDCLEFSKRDFLLNDRPAKVMYVKDYVAEIDDDVIKELTGLGIELAISIHATAYDQTDILAEIVEAKLDADAERIKQSKRAAQNNVYIDNFETQAAEDSSVAGQWRSEVKNGGQKVFKGMISVFFTADNYEQLNLYQSQIERAGRKVGVTFADIYYHQDDALNTILPIGFNYLDLSQNLRIKKKFTRSMTTANLATQIPFSEIDLISDSPIARYYGQNQNTNNMITLDRKRDLNTPSGVILGSSGSGKSMTTKLEIKSTLLKYPRDKVIIIDPEEEYLDIGREYGATVIDVAIDSPNHFNLLDRPNSEKLQSEDRNTVGDKANLLITLFSQMLSDFDDEALTLIDRVTEETYTKYESPTLVEWHGMLKEQPEEYAQTLALKLEIYTKGSYGIFSKATNVDINNRFIIFNLKKLSGNLKTFAMMVLQEFLWNQVVEARKDGVTIWIYYDELQLYFEEEVLATYFNFLWSRIRKYGCIPTGITQMPETLTASPQGRKLLGNSEFKILLKLEGLALEEVKKIAKLTDQETSNIETPKAKGTGLIVAGSTIVPFENPIPEDTRLYQLISTDA